MADVDYVFKVLVLGDSSVGKSSLIKRFHSNVFDQRLPTTIGVDFFIHDLEVDGKKIKVLSFLHVLRCANYKLIKLFLNNSYASRSRELKQFLRQTLKERRKSSYNLQASAISSEGYRSIFPLREFCS